MTPISLELRNFRSVRHLLFKFPQGPGLFFMRGVNEVEPRLEGNGAGKSTLWDALYWVQHDHTPAGLRAGDVCMWGEEKGVCVTWVFDVAGTQHTLQRTWGPRSWTLDGQDISKQDNPLQHLIPLSAQTWLCSVHMAQAQPMFLDLKPEAKATLFSQVVDAEQWLERSKRASARAADIDKLLRADEQTLARLEGELAALRRQDPASLSRAWHQQQKEHLQHVEREYEAASVREKQLKADLQQVRDQLQELGNRIGDVELDGQDLLLERGGVPTAEEVQRLRSSISVLQHQHRQAQEVMQELRGQQGTCPHCRQPVTQQHRNTVLAQQQRIAEQAQRERVQQEQELHRMVQEQECADKQLDEVEAKLHDLERQEREAKFQERQLVEQQAQLQHTFDSLEARAAQLECQVCPHTAAEQQHQRQLTSISTQVEGLRQHVQQQQEQYMLCTMWARSFKELRLLQIAQALQQLEVEVNSRLVQLGLVGWSLHFAVDQETASGSVKRGFTVRVSSPHNERTVPWEAWSGGEGQRLRLGAAMGLGDLVRAQTGCDLGLEVWDEPTAWLSPQGVADLLETLAERAVLEGRQIWVVDHRTLGFGRFSGTCTIIKSSTGTRCEQEHA